MKETFAAVPERFGVVWGLTNHFVPRPDDGASFAERMTLRVVSAAPINDPTSPYRPHAKVAHRPDPAIVIRYGAHLVRSSRLAPLSDWYVADVFHFPFRSLDQYVRKGLRQARAEWRLGQYVKVFHANDQGRVAAVFDSLVVDDVAVERGLAIGALVADTRLRDALREFTNEPRESQTGVDDHIVQAAALREADVVRLSRRLDDLTARVAAAERVESRR